MIFLKGELKEKNVKGYCKWERGSSPAKRFALELMVARKEPHHLQLVVHKIASIVFPHPITAPMPVQVQKGPMKVADLPKVFILF